jgi:hypothetical protein
MIRRRTYERMEDIESGITKTIGSEQKNTVAYTAADTNFRDNSLKSFDNYTKGLMNKIITGEYYVSKPTRIAMKNALKDLIAHAHNKSCIGTKNKNCKCPICLLSGTITQE